MYIYIAKVVPCPHTSAVQKDAFRTSKKKRPFYLSLKLLKQPSDHVKICRDQLTMGCEAAPQKTYVKRIIQKRFGTAPYQETKLV